MPFSNEGKAMIKNYFYQFKKYGSWRILTEFLSKINCKKEGLDTLLKRI